MVEYLIGIDHLSAQQLLSSPATPQLNLTALAMGKCVFQPGVDQIKEEYCCQNLQTSKHLVTPCVIVLFKGKYAMVQTIAAVGKMSLSRFFIFHFFEIKTSDLEDVKIPSKNTF